MTTSDMIRELCEKKNISLAELVRCIGQLPQNFNKKLQRETVSYKEILGLVRKIVRLVLNQQNCNGGKVDEGQE